MAITKDGEFVLDERMSEDSEIGVRGRRHGRNM
jgi:hypothetical protein